MENSAKHNQTVIFLWVFVPLAASILLHSLFLTPLYLTLASDVAWNGTFLPQTVGYLQLLLEYAFYWLLFVFLWKRTGKRKVFITLLVILVSILIRQGVELVMGYVVMGFPTWQTFFSEEFSYTILQLSLDGVLMVFAALIIHSVKQFKRCAFLLSALPVVFQLVSLAIMLIGFGSLTKEEWLEAALDVIVHIVCLFAGFGVICFLNRRLGKEKEDEKTL